MTNTELAEWLLEYGGPVIRYRTAVELLDTPTYADVERLRRDLLASAPVRKWTRYLSQSKSARGYMHGSRPVAFENAIGKLAELGVFSGMRPCDRGALPFLKWLKAAPKQCEGFAAGIRRPIIAAGLARAGYLRERAVRAFWIERLDELDEVVRNRDYDIYVPTQATAGFPRAFRGKPFIKPEYCPGGHLKVPLIHDMYGLAELIGTRCDNATAKKIAAVAGYILASKYQAFPDGYGYVVERRNGTRRYVAIGWDVKLPGYFGLDRMGRGERCLVQRVELMARFPAARTHPWFRRSMQHLEALRTGQGTYRFPASYLNERASGYYVVGAYMGLGENRRSKMALELESTFRMLRLKRLAKD